MLSRDSRQEKKLKALRRAQFRLGQRFDYIDWEEDVLMPEVAALKAGSEVVGLIASAAFDMKVVQVDAELGTEANHQTSDDHRSDPDNGGGETA